MVYVEWLHFESHGLQLCFSDVLVNINGAYNYKTKNTAPDTH